MTRSIHRTPRFALCLAVLLAAAFASDAFARGRMYNPESGRFMQRDPRGVALSAQNIPRRSLRGFIPRETYNPFLQYADGMNLYQRTKSQVTMLLDPTGKQSYQHPNPHIAAPRGPIQNPPWDQSGRGEEIIPPRTEPGNCVWWSTHCPPAEDGWDEELPTNDPADDDPFPIDGYMKDQGCRPRPAEGCSDDERVVVNAEPIDKNGRGNNDYHSVWRDRRTGKMRGKPSNNGGVYEFPYDNDSIVEHMDGSYPPWRSKRLRVTKWCCPEPCKDN